MKQHGSRTPYERDLRGPRARAAHGVRINAMSRAGIYAGVKELSNDSGIGKILGCAVSRKVGIWCAGAPVMVSCSDPTRMSALTVATKSDGSSRSSHLYVLKPASVNVTT